MTFADLKAELEKLTPEQLARPVMWSGDERGGAIDHVEILEEDMINPSGDMWEPVSSYAENPNAPNDCTMTADELAAEPRVAYAGQPILVEA